MQMIKVQHNQCLKEAQLENETTGEAPSGKKEPPRSPPPSHREPRSTLRSRPSDQMAAPPGLHSPILCSPPLAQQPWGENGRK